MKNVPRKRLDVEMSKLGAYLHSIRNGKRPTVIPNKKKESSRKFCRGKGRLT